MSTPQNPALGMARLLLTRIAVPFCRPSPTEYAWFRKRLADPGLLDSAVGVKVGAALIAVPVGGSRRGGYRVYRSASGFRARNTIMVVPV